MSTSGTEKSPGASQEDGIVELVRRLLIASGDRGLGALGSELASGSVQLRPTTSEAGDPCVDVEFLAGGFPSLINGRWLIAAVSSSTALAELVYGEGQVIRLQLEWLGVPSPTDGASVWGDVFHALLNDPAAIFHDGGARTVGADSVRSRRPTRRELRDRRHKTRPGT